MLDTIASDVETEELLSFAEIAEESGQPMLALAFRLERASRLEINIVPMQQLTLE